MSALILILMGKGGFQPERLAQFGLEVSSIRCIQGLDTAYWGFLGVRTTLDIFQNIIFIPYFQYGVLRSSGYGVLSFIPLWSLSMEDEEVPLVDGVFEALEMEALVDGMVVCGG
ncbi:hypothetical protein Tco_1499237 [Tanacetum coccineum]